MNKLLSTAAFVLLAALPCFSAGEQGTAPAARETSPAAALSAFGENFCDASLKGLKATLDYINLEFGLRITMDEKELKSTGMTVEEALKQNEEMIRALADDPAESDTKADKCTVSASTPMECEDVYSRIVKDGAYGMSIDEKQIKAAAKTMGISRCGIVSIKIKAGRRDQDIDIAAAEFEGQWKVLTGFTAPPQTNEDAGTAKQGAP